MSFLNKAKSLGLVGAAALSLTLVGPALAANNDVTTTVESGTLGAFVSELTLSSATLDFTSSDTATGNLVLHVEDATDTAAGWHVSIESTDFARTGGGGSITADNFVLSTPGAPAMEGTGSQAVSSTASQGPLVVGTGGALDSAVNVIEAYPLFGEGAYTQTIGSTLTIPAGTVTGDYTATLTVVSTAGPIA